MNEFRKTYILYTSCKHGNPKDYICTLKSNKSKIMDETTNILALKYGNVQVIEYIHDIKNKITWFRKKLSKYPTFVLIEQ